ncbi:MAG: hypothetical protein ACRDQF_06460 [Thermocrispum sp.]
MPVQDLAATVIRELMSRTGLAPDSVDDLILGHCYGGSASGYSS